ECRGRGYKPGREFGGPGLGGTGYQPVFGGNLPPKNPPGGSPAGTGQWPVLPLRKWGGTGYQPVFGGNLPPKNPPGGSPAGTGQWPVLPLRKLQTNSAEAAAGITATQPSWNLRAGLSCDANKSPFIEGEPRPGRARLLPSPDSSWDQGSAGASPYHAGASS